MKKKIMTIIGTRPEIIRLSIIITKVDDYFNHILVHTGQNYDYNLNELFFKELEVRKPDYFLGIKEKKSGAQIGKILSESEKVILKEKPEALIILGDTNSGLTSIIAKKLGIPVYHLEAGNRCYDDRVPEEVNRRIIDHSSSVLMPYTNRSKENLLREGIERERIFVIGNPIFEVINHFKVKISISKILDKLNLKKQEFFLVTTHRAENVDIKERLQNIVNSLQSIFQKYKFPIICSFHPRTKDKMLQYGILKENYRIEFLEPLGFFDFIKLEKNAYCVLTDSGTVQEECCIFNTPNITIRDVTERPETIECGSNIITGNNPDDIESCVNVALKESVNWKVPDEYLTENVSAIVMRILSNYNFYKK